MSRYRWKCKFPMNTNVRLLVSWFVGWLDCRLLVGQSVRHYFLKRAGSYTSNSLLGALVVHYLLSKSYHSFLNFSKLLKSLYPLKVFVSSVLIFCKFISNIRLYIFIHIYINKNKAISYINYISRMGLRRVNRIFHFFTCVITTPSPGTCPLNI